MKGIIVVAITFTLANVLAYHDPDLNYHLSQIQKLDGCDNKGGYAYPAPAVQLTTAGVKVAPAYNQHGLAAPTYQYSNTAGYSSAASAGYTSGAYTSGAAYQAVAPQLTYASQPAAQYQAVVSHGYAPAPTYTTQVQSKQKEVHGYATSAGLSSASSSTRTVIPQATYAQAPILAKITGAPLIAKFAVAPAKTTYVTQNLAAQQQASYATGSLAKASLNSYSTVQHGGPVVTQLYAAPAAAKYAASPALRLQYVQQQYITPERYTAVAGPSTIHAQVGPISALTPVAPVAPQYRGQPQYVSQYSAGVQYAGPAVTQYAAPVVAQYATPAVAQYTTPAVTGHYTQYSTPVVTQHYAATAARHYSAPAVVKSAPVVSHYSAPAVAQYATNSVSPGYYSAPEAHVQAAPAVAHVASVAHVAAPAVAHVAAPTHVAPAIQVHAGHHSGHGKNVHKEFVENYDAHPRYAYEYSVNDPHTGDVKQQKEERDGEVVKGQYSLVEPDGSVRTVNYVADWETGFHADVRNSKDNQH